MSKHNSGEYIINLSKDKGYKHNNLLSKDEGYKRCFDTPPVQRGGNRFTIKYRQCIGHRHVVLSRGVQFLEKKGECHWLTIGIASILPSPEDCLSAYGDKFAHFQVWTLRISLKGRDTVKSRHTRAVLEARANIDGPVIISDVFEDTDFPFLDGEPFNFYVAPMQLTSQEYENPKTAYETQLVYVLMLPQEYQQGT